MAVVGLLCCFLWVVSVCICVEQSLFTGWVGWLVCSLLQMLFVVCVLVYFGLYIC